MQIINLTRKTVIASDVKILQSLQEQSLGMLRYKTPRALLIHTRFGIHTYFMKYPIDILVLDKSGKVVALKKHLQPNSVFVWNPSYNVILELPPHTIQQNSTKIGDIIEFEKSDKDLL